MSQSTHASTEDFQQRLADTAQVVLREAVACRITGSERGALLLEEQAQELAWYLSIERLAQQRKYDLSNTAAAVTARVVRATEKDTSQNQGSTIRL